MTICILASLAASLRNFRGPLIVAMRASGHEVHAMAPGLRHDTETRDWLTEHGVICHDIPLSRAGLNPLADLRAMMALRRLLLRIEPDVFLGYTAKPVIWGLIAAYLARVPQRVALITGLGYAFTEGSGVKRRVIAAISQRLYRLALARATLVFFQNPDDRADFRRMGLIPPDVPVGLVAGSGVDLDLFPLQPLPPRPLRFLLIARLVADKGIREYVAAARRVKAGSEAVEFHLVGGLDPNPAGIRVAEMRTWQAEGFIHWHGEVSDVRPFLARAHVFVLPSYREGTPRTALEAMATGRAIITTDAPGCRETVVDGVNGYLVPVRDADALAAAMERFLLEPERIGQMGAESRRIAVEKFDVRKVNRVMLDTMGLT